MGITTSSSAQIHQRTTIGLDLPLSPSMAPKFSPGAFQMAKPLPKRKKHGKQLLKSTHTHKGWVSRCRNKPCCKLSVEQQ